MTANMPAILCLSMFALLLYPSCNNLPSISGGKDSDKFLNAALFGGRFLKKLLRRFKYEMYRLTATLTSWKIHTEKLARENLLPEHPPFMNSLPASCGEVER